MNAKELKKYELVIRIGNTLPEDGKIIDLFSELAGVDFTAAVEVWTYMLNTYASELSQWNLAQNLEGNIFSLLSSKSDAKLKQMLGDSPTLGRLIYSSSATSCVGGNLAYLTGLILGSKIEQASSVLQMVAANKNTNMEFGERMKLVLDDVFTTYCAKNSAKVPSLNRKQTMLLLEYALKIKGANKNLLVQRIKELG